jgi:hypothetical protein
LAWPLPGAYDQAMRCACVFSPRQALLLPFAVLLATGCASEGDALDKRFAKLQEELTRVQSQTDRMAERLDAIELRQATAPKSDGERVVSAAPTTTARPKLKVVRVEADGDVLPDESQAPADEAGPRLIIQGEGKSIESRSVPGTAKSAPKPTESGKKAEPAKAAPK